MPVISKNHISLQISEGDICKRADASISVMNTVSFIQTPNKHGVGITLLFMR